MPDRHVINRDIIFALPHFPAYRAVQFADSIGGASGVEREHGHAKRFVFILCIEPAKRHEILVGETQVLLISIERITHEAGVEAVMPGRDRRVRGKDAFFTCGTQGSVKVIAGRHAFPD